MMSGLLLICAVAYVIYCVTGDSERTEPPNTDVMDTPSYENRQSDALNDGGRTNEYGEIVRR